MADTLFDKNDDLNKGGEPNQDDLNKKQNDDPGNNPPNDPPATPSVEDATNDLLASIKNDKGEQKYRSVEDALKALGKSQEFIDTLLSEKRQLEEKQSNVEELKDILSSVRDKNNDPGQASVDSLSKDDVVSILEQREKEKVIRDNLEKVRSTLDESFGAEKSAKLEELIETTGMSKAQIDSLAKESPAALFKLLGVKQRKPAPPMESSVNTNNFNGGQEPKRKSAMRITSSKELANAWKESKERTLKRLEEQQK